MGILDCAERNRLRDSDFVRVCDDVDFEVSLTGPSNDMNSPSDQPKATLQTSAHMVRLPWRLAFFGCWLFFGITCVLFDSQIQPWLNKAGHVSLVHTVADHWEQLGSTLGIVLFILVGAFSIRSDNGRTLAQFVLSVSVTGTSVQGLKYFIGRVRPAVTGDATLFAGPMGLFSMGTTHRIDSMPSGHTAAAFAMALALASRWPKYTWLWIILASGVGISRTLVDAHFPSDVILGALLGTLIGLLMNSWADRVRYQKPRPPTGPVPQTTSPAKWIGQ
jgi:membrane-associated phospholipid phosphatase